MALRLRILLGKEWIRHGNVLSYSAFFKLSPRSDGIASHGHFDMVLIDPKERKAKGGHKGLNRLLRIS